MRWWLLIVTLLMGGCSENELRVMTYNVRYGTADDGPNHWSLRREALVRSIRTFHPDVLGTQETLAMQRDYLVANLPGYAAWGVGRDDGKEAGEMSAVFYRADRFRLLDSGHFWLSPKPDVVASVGWDAALTRMASWVKLQPKSDPSTKPILVINAHLDNRGAESRLESAKLINAKAAAIGEGCSVIVTGDFNCAEDDPPYRAALGDDLRDAYRVIHPSRQPDELTFHGFHPDRTHGSRIDWILVDSDWTPGQAFIDRTLYGAGKAPSDHFPVCVTLKRSALSSASQ